MSQSLPCGAPFYYSRKNDKFSLTVAIDESGWSYEAQDWLNYMQYDPRFIKPDGTYYTIMTALSGERRITHNGKAWSVDGFVETNNGVYLFEYYGCYYHSHNCGVTPIKNTSMNDAIKEKILKLYGTLITIYGCEWKSQRKHIVESDGPWFNGPTSTLSKFYYRKGDITENEILQAVFNKSFYGLIMVDLDTPDILKQSFQKLNCGTIFQRIVVTEKMLNSKMLNICETKKMRFPTSEQLSMVYKTNGYLCTTDMLLMYKEWGMSISNVTFAIEDWVCDKEKSLLMKNI